MKLHEEWTADKWIAWCRDKEGGDMLYVRILPDPQYYCGIRALMFHYTLLKGAVGDTMGYDDRWCYTDDLAPVLLAMVEWDGKGDPFGWQRHPSTGRRRPDGDPAREYIEY